MIGIYASAITFAVTASGLKEKKQLFESKEQQDYVEKYEKGSSQTNFIEKSIPNAIKPFLLIFDANSVDFSFNCLVFNPSSAGIMPFNLYQVLFKTTLA